MSQVYILQEVTSCNYPSNSKDYITNIILEIFTLYKSTKFFKVNKGSGTNVDLIIALRINIPTTYANSLFDIPVIVYLSKNFPYSAPDVYIEKSRPDLGINLNNKNIDPNSGRILTKTLVNWNSYATIPFVLKEINYSFNENFPVYQMKKQEIQEVQERISVGYKQNVQVSSESGSRLSVGSFSGVTERPSVGNIQNVQPNVQQNIQQNLNDSRQSQTSVGSSGSQQSQDSFRSPQLQPNIGDPNAIVKSILLDEIKKPLYTKIYSELSLLQQENENLQKFKTELIDEINKYKRYETGQADIIEFLKHVINDMNQEFSIIKKSVDDRKDKIISKDNALSFIEISDKKIINLISIEATYEDLIGMIKKAFERQVIGISEVIKLTRLISKEIIKVREYRTKIVNTKFR